MTCLAFNASIEEEKDKSWLKVRSDPSYILQKMSYKYLVWANQRLGVWMNTKRSWIVLARSNEKIPKNHAPKFFIAKIIKVNRLDLISIKLYFMLPIDLINIIDDGIIDTITTIQIKKLDGAVIMLWDFNLSTLVVAMTVTLTRFFLI